MKAGLFAPPRYVASADAGDRVPLARTCSRIAGFKIVFYVKNGTFSVLFRDFYIGNGFVFGISILGLDF